MESLQELSGFAMSKFVSQPLESRLLAGIEDCAIGNSDVKGTIKARLEECFV